MGAGDGSSLGALAALTMPRPARFLCLVGQHRKPALEASLNAAGFDLVLHIAYEARAAGAWPDATLRRIASGAVDTALHFSRRSACLAIAAARGSDVLGKFSELGHLCLSRDCAEPLARAGMRRIAVAAKPDEESLLGLLSTEFDAAAERQ